jgi:hypothetical protein
VKELRLVVVGCQLARLVAVAGCGQVGLAVLLAPHHVLAGWRLARRAALRLVAVVVVAGCPLVRLAAAAVAGCHLACLAALVSPPLVVAGCH